MKKPLQLLRRFEAKIVKPMKHLTIHVTDEVKKVPSEYNTYGNVQMRETKNNFMKLLQIYPTEIDTMPPVINQVSLTLDTSRVESKRLVTRWRHRQMLLRVESLAGHFRNVPTIKMIDDTISRLGWSINMKPSYYTQIQNTCALQRRGHSLPNILTESDTNDIKELIKSQKWPSLFVKDNLVVRGRGIFAYANITKIRLYVIIRELT